MRIFEVLLKIEDYMHNAEMFILYAVKQVHTGLELELFYNVVKHKTSRMCYTSNPLFYFGIIKQVKHARAQFAALEETVLAVGSSRALSRVSP